MCNRYHLVESIEVWKSVLVGWAAEMGSVSKAETRWLDITGSVYSSEAGRQKLFLIAFVIPPPSLDVLGEGSERWCRF